MNKMPVKRIYFLDYLRVYAFASVLIGHEFFMGLTHFVNSFSMPHIGQQYLATFFLEMFNGGSGVVVFFMISGYIILHVLQKEKPFEFFIKRIFRIYPLLIFAIFFHVVLVYLFHHKPIDLSITFMQMSLFGDFSNTPLALNGIEWTLRVEIMFYLFMFALSFTQILRKNMYILYAFLSMLTLSMKYISPFPTDHHEFNLGFFTTYMPFLFLGSVVYMYEKKNINFTALLAFIIIVFYHYFKAIEAYTSQQLGENFAMVGFFIFMVLWLLRDKLYTFPTTLNKSMTLLALLTYPVYLFHKFLWEYIAKFLGMIGTENQIFIVLLLFAWCFVVYKLIETPMNDLGKKISKKLYC